MPDQELPVEKQSWLDKILKRLMPNGTVMRRYIAAAYIAGVVCGLVALQLIDRTDSNTKRGGLAICAVLDYAEDAAAAARGSNQITPGAVQRLDQLVQDMKDTGVSCPVSPE